MNKTLWIIFGIIAIGALLFFFTKAPPPVTPPVNITPENQPVIIDEKTEVVLNPKAIEIPIKEISKIGEKIPENKIILLKTN